MQDKGKFAIYIFLVMLIVAFGLRLVNFITKNGKIEINNQTFKVEILKNSWELQKGLSGRDKLAENVGILFVFNKPDTYSFWMKDMKFPIDIIWINDNRIVYIKENAPIPTTKTLENYTPDKPAKYVLEINAGLSQKYGFKVGDSVKMEL